jgi:hypothetical protein
MKTGMAVNENPERIQRLHAEITKVVSQNRRELMDPGWNVSR